MLQLKHQLFYPMEFPYIIKKSKRARHLSLAVRCDASVVLTVPRRVSLRDAQSFLNQKLDWVKEKLDFYKNSPNNSIDLRGSRADYLRYKEAARKLIKQRLEYFCEIYQLEFNRLAIKNQTNCWGSCSMKKNLNFNYRLLLLPAELCDYIVVHELCHLKELNHGQRFWQLVSQTVPDHKAKRKILRDDYRIK